MYTIMDYLDWRGDIPFEAVACNEVDSLIFSELVYTEMDRIFREGMSIRELCEAYEDACISQDDFMFDPYPLLKKAAATARFGPVKLRGFINRINDRKRMQFAAVTFVTGSDSIYVAYRGTDSTLTGWREDLNMSLGKATPGQVTAAMYIEDAAEYAENVYVGGHSKGGNFAVYAAAFCTEETNRHIRHVWSHDGPGFPDDSAQDPEFLRIAGRTTHFIPEASLVGILMRTPGERIIVRSNALSYLQHNPYSWGLLGARFDLADELSGFAGYAETVLDSWLGGLSVKQRRMFIDTVFNALEGTGAATVQDIQQNPVKILASFREEMHKADPQMQEAVSDILKQLSARGFEELKDTVSEKLGRKDK